MCCVLVDQRRNYYHHHQSSYTHSYLICRLDSTITPPMSLSMVDQLVLDYGTQPAKMITTDSAHFPIRTLMSFSFASHWSTPTHFPTSLISGTRKSTTMLQEYQKYLSVQSLIFVTTQLSWKDFSLASKVQ